MTRFLFLYTELAEYFLHCARTLHAREGVEVHIVRWPVNKEAPFEFHVPEGMQVHRRDEYDRNALRELVSGIDPDMILTSGWIDPDYLRIVREWADRIPTVLVLDNQWRGGLRQGLGRFWARFRFTPFYSHAWVPGEPQAEYARRIGFSEERIHTGFYVANVDRFGKLWKERGEELPRRFIYVGRYMEHKGIWDLWKAFQELREEEKEGRDWELWCCGTGEQYEQRPDLPGLKHFGFVQPDDMPEIILQSSVFVLPSHFEPWGVVVQEFAASGAPLLLSDAVGAGSAYLEPGKNGFRSPSGDPSSIKERMRNFVRMDPSTLQKMGEHSHSLGMHPTPDEWADTALSMLKRAKS